MLGRPVWHGTVGISVNLEEVGWGSPGVKASPGGRVLEDSAEGIVKGAESVERGSRERLGVLSVNGGIGKFPVLPRGTAIAQEAQKATVTRAANDLEKCMVKLGEIGCNG